MTYRSSLCIAFAAMFAGAAQAAVLSGNIVTNGDFESLDNLKNDVSPDGINPHRFSTEYDFSKWLGIWGPPNNPGGLGGFSVYDDPRDLNVTGGDTQTTGNLGNFNRSVDPTNASNHVMESIMFRGSFFQWIPAPENHVPGPISFSFDLHYSEWAQHTADPPWGQLWVIGTNTPPQHNSNVFNGDVSAGGLWPDDGDILFFRNWGEWMQGSYEPGDPGDPFQFFDTWHHISTDEYLENEEGSPIEPDGTPAYLWWATREIHKEVTQAYDYYVIWATPLVYAEDDLYWWLYNAKIADNPVHLLDNIDLRVSVEEAVVYLPGDFDGSGTVDTQDINPFILALTNPGQYQTQYGVDPVVYDTNNDDVINTEDINPFIIILTGGGQNAIIPEPASFALLAMGGLALMRRR